MQFREQGQKVQCIRSTYDPSIKRSRQRVVASFSRWAEKLPAHGLDALTPDERQELEEWFSARQAQQAQRRNLDRISVAERDLNALAEAIRSVDLTDERAASIWQGLDAVAKALRKAGHKKPKRGRSSPVVVPGQTDWVGTTDVSDKMSLTG